MKSSLSDQKKVLRKKFQNKLKKISFFDLIDKSEKLRERFLNELVRPHLKHVHQKPVISFYPFDTEPQINIEDESQMEPYHVAYIRIHDWPNRLMEARLARRDQPGQWEEIEPVPGVRIFQPAFTQALCQPQDISMILVPALAFSESGDRLGRGAGFYDRFLKTAPHALRVGVGVQEQMTTQIPCEAWDQPLDLIITDQGFFSTNRFSEWQNHGKVISRDTPERKQVTCESCFLETFSENRDDRL